MISGARNMIPIAVATAAAGIIVGTISLTGRPHQVVSAFIEALARPDQLPPQCSSLVAVMSLILGMGLPTTANYIVVSSLMAPVIVSLGRRARGSSFPRLSSPPHLFVFYFGILADDTPPVGPCRLRGGRASPARPHQDGLPRASPTNIRTALLPLHLSIFPNTELPPDGGRDRGRRSPPRSSWMSSPAVIGVFVGGHHFAMLVPSRRPRSAISSPGGERRGGGGRLPSSSPSLLPAARVAFLRPPSHPPLRPTSWQRLSTPSRREHSRRGSDACGSAPRGDGLPTNPDAARHDVRFVVRLGDGGDGEKEKLEATGPSLLRRSGRQGDR